MSFSLPAVSTNLACLLPGRSRSAQIAPSSRSLLSDISTTSGLSTPRVFDNKAKGNGTMQDASAVASSETRLQKVATTISESISTCKPILKKAAMFVAAGAVLLVAGGLLMSPLGSGVLNVEGAENPDPVSASIAIMFKGMFSLAEFALEKAFN